jgi:hypothetical protein
MGKTVGRARLGSAAIVACAAVAIAAGCSGKTSGLDEPTIDEPSVPDPGGSGTLPPGDPVEPGEPQVQGTGPELSRVVVINGVELDGVTIDALEGELGWAVADGAYWYDTALGAVGLEGGPTAGFLPAGLTIGGPLLEDASGGTTGVVVNGRELPEDDLVALEQLFGAPIPPGRYFLDADGYYGYEGAIALGNVFDVVAASEQSGGGGFVEETAGGWIGSDGSDGYYFDPESGCSVMAGDGVSC